MRARGCHLLPAGAWILLAFFACVAFTSDAASDANVRVLSRKMSGKFGRGLVNIATGWGEMVRCPIEVARRRGALLGATWGPLKGIAMTVFRTAGGACETALFFYPLPENYAPFFESEFVFSRPPRQAPPPQ